MGSVELWDKAEGDLESVLLERKVDFQINPGDGAFYGPKIDFHILDSLGRSWQCGTVQLDFQMPEKFDCEYIGEDNKAQRPILIHRAIYGSIERFMAILIEHYGGDFPLWLAPIQVKILPIGDAHLNFANELKGQLDLEGIRVDIDERIEKIGLKIREAELLKIPYMMVVGDREMESNSIALRKRKQGNIGVFKIGDVIARIKEDLKK